MRTRWGSTTWYSRPVELHLTDLLGDVQDIEGVYSQGQYYVVQSRPQIIKKQ